MYPKLKNLKKNRLFVKNKELEDLALKSILKVHRQVSLNKKFTNIFTYKAYKIKKFPFFNSRSSRMRGYSIASNRRKAFYSLFQLTRFEIKRLVSERMLVGILSAK
jgi:hypothetical protein